MGSTLKDIDGVGEIYFYGTPKLVDEGIGRYEYWGTIGYHSDIQPTMEDSEITWDAENGEALTLEQDKIIQQYLNDNIEEIENAIIQDHDFEPDYPDEY
jgi:hypothetical protein